jgi:stage II sporulation protein D
MEMKRRTFALSVLATVGMPRIARATGGLDIEDASDGRKVRVLLASEPREMPQQIDSWRFAWNGRTYRGTFSLVDVGGGRRGLINTVPIDAYLYGVLGSEIGAAWPAAVLQAQAVTARTFAVTKLRPDRQFDVTAGDSDQHYGGVEAESVAGRAAVDATSGTIMIYEGKPAHVAFGACCGGRTADAGDVWGTSYPYLTSRTDPNCGDAPNFEWRAEVPADDLVRALDLHKIGSLRGVELRPADGSGRPRAIGFDGSNGSEDVPTREFRSAAGGLVHSTFVREVNLEKRGDRVVASGTGNGHGVGLCQWGARGMGANGARPDDILAFYFPGTTIGRA